MVECRKPFVMHWKHMLQEQPGSYQFSGPLYVTDTVAATIHLEDILSLFLFVREFVEAHGGAEQIQIFESEAGDRLYLIDQLSPEMLASSRYKEADNFCTLLYSSEY